MMPMMEMVPPAGALVLDTGAGRIWQGEDGVVREQITIRHLDDAAIEARYLAYEELISAGPVPVVIDLGRLIFLSAEIRQHAQTPRALRLLGALALVVRSPVTRVVAKFFRRLMGAPYPIRLFADEASAVEWALSQGEGAR